MRSGKLKIVLFGDPVLRQKAKPVTVFHKKLGELIDSMAAALRASGEGAALAANQVGVLKRITVIEYEGEYFEMVNPEILESEGSGQDYEGCLSLPGYAGMVERFTKIKVKYFDRDGKENVIEREGKMARCIQHELDHLDGILYIDRMKEEFLVNNEDDDKLEVSVVMKTAGPRPE